MFVSAGGENNQNYKKFSIALDERKKTAEEADKIGEFIQFFQNTFLSPVTITQSPSMDIPDENNNGNRMTQEMAVFVDRELIGKDFKNIASIFPATLSNIYAEVRDGEYDISINGVHAQIRNGDLANTVEYSGKYLFSQSTHAFYRLSIQVIDDSGGREFGGSSITLSPSRIDLISFEKISREIPRYINTLRNAKYSGNEKATFDLSRQVVIIGANEYPLGN